MVLENKTNGGHVLWMNIPIFSLFSACGSQVYWRRKPEYQEKTTDLSQVTDKLYHKMFIEYTSS
jgi:hypothetical protein